MLNRGGDEKVKELLESNSLKSTSQNINDSFNLNSEKNKDEIIQDVIELNSADQSISSNENSVGVEVIQNGISHFKKKTLILLMKIF